MLIPISNYSVYLSIRLIDEIYSCLVSEYILAQIMKINIRFERYSISENVFSFEEGISPYHQQKPQPSLIAKVQKAKVAKRSSKSKVCLLT